MSHLYTKPSCCVYINVVYPPDLAVPFWLPGIGSANGVAKWTSSAWSALGSGLGTGGWVNALAVSGSDLYVGGYFTTAVGGSANCVAKWDGSTWSALGSGLNNVVNALAVSGSDLYVAGYFYTAGGSSANSVAKWTGSAWSALGAGLGASGWVYALAVSGSDVYVGGNFYTAGGSNANLVAKWNGSAWSALGEGLGDQYGASVNALAVSGSDLYVGGYFTTAGGNGATNVAKWNGIAWSALGSGVGGGPYDPVFGPEEVNALAVSGRDLYVGGAFTTAGGTSAANVSKWDGTAWSALGSGMNGTVNALTVSGTNFYAGGAFTTAGGKVSGYAARAIIEADTNAATVALGNLSQTYDGTAKSVSVTTAPAGLAVDVTYNGSADVPTNVGNYIVIGVVNDGNYHGSAINTLAIVIPGNSTNVLSAQSATLAAGQSATASTSPVSRGQAGTSVTATNGGGGTLLVVVANYGTQPAGASYIDIRVWGADGNDSVSAKFYYPSTISGNAEASMALDYWDGTNWSGVRGVGGSLPVQETADNLDGTVAGGRFSVIFGPDNTPTLTGLTGTVFTLGLTVWQPPQLEIACSGPELLLSWLTNGPAFVVETSSNLSSGAVWRIITNGVNMSGDRSWVTSQPDSSPAFYRLRQQTISPAPVGMALIPTGLFTMGDNLDGTPSALPAHTVYVSAF